ncbi:hypothetical protein [Pyrococcus kukulkanii]|uniref:Uncharacterized protein n=1 Tax=Pyrococcus kukulkanii TaxID=1609559 RepID=A0ABV4T918_9EURY
MGWQEEFLSILHVVTTSVAVLFTLGAAVQYKHNPIIAKILLVGALVSAIVWALVEDELGHYTDPYATIRNNKK